MEVILLQDYPSLGFPGDVVKVKRGYARNFLIPNGVAAECSGKNKRIADHYAANLKTRKSKLKEQASQIAVQLKEIAVSFTVKVGDAGKIFGTISAKNIEEFLKEKGHELDRRRIRLMEPVKRAGSYQAVITLHPEVEFHLPFTVLAESGPEKSIAKGGRKAKGARKSTKKQEDGESVGEAEIAEVEAEKA